LAAVREIFAKDKQTAVGLSAKWNIPNQIRRTASALFTNEIHHLHFKPLERYNIIEAEAAIEGSQEVKAAIQKPGLSTR